MNRTCIASTASTWYKRFKDAIAYFYIYITVDTTYNLNWHVEASFACVSFFPTYEIDF